MFLDAHRDLKGFRNGLAVRLNKNTPRDFLQKACEVHRVTAGIAFFNDDVVSHNLMGDGYSLEDARDYSICGCAEPIGTENNNGNTAYNSLLSVALLETTLYEGCRSTSSWQRIGLATPPANSRRSKMLRRHSQTSLIILLSIVCEEQMFVMKWLPKYALFHCFRLQLKVA